MATTYLGFVAVAVGLPAALLAVWTALRRPYEGLGRHLVGLVILTAVALIYTIPWDSTMIARGVWTYGDGVVADRLWRMPLGEYSFIAVQPWLAGLWLYHVDYADPIPDVPLRIGAPARLVGVAAGAAIGAAGVVLATPLDGPGLYLGSTLAWAAPVLALQWGFGWTFLWRQRSVLLSAVAVPTVYLWLVDLVALQRGLWTIERRLGPEVAGLPLEEMVFFALTTLFVVQGLMLWYWLIDRWKRRTT